MRLLFFLLFFYIFVDAMQKPEPVAFDGNKIFIKASAKIPAAKNTFYEIDFLKKMQNASTREEGIECWKQLFCVLLQQELKHIPERLDKNDYVYDYYCNEELSVQIATELKACKTMVLQPSSHVLTTQDDILEDTLWLRHRDS